MTETFAPPAGTRWCPSCDGLGEVAYCDFSLNHFTGVNAYDPQCDFTEPCRRCGGDCFVLIVTASPGPHAVAPAGRAPALSSSPSGSAQPNPSPKRDAVRRATPQHRPRPQRAA